METSSTLAQGERRMRPLVLAVLAACGIAGAWLLCATRPGAARLAAGTAWLALTASNVAYLVRHRTTTVGMAPVSVVSVAPPAAAALALPRQALPPAAAAATSAALAASVAATGVLLWWFFRLRRAYAHAAAPAPDAAVIVLGGAVRHGRPRPTLARRLDVALGLLRESGGRTLVLTGGPLAHEGGCESEAMARYLEGRGADPGRILLEKRARNTAENVRLSLELLRRTGVAGQRCVLTSDYHLYRALREGERLGCRLLPVPAPTPWQGRLQQWSREVLTIVAQRAWRS